MTKVSIKNLKGEKVKDITLADSIFGVEVNDHLVHLAVVNQLANNRQGTQSTKNRSAVRGGGKKPWRQKGTGRARQGSIRSPQWTGGGVVFAPKPRDFAQKINKKMKEAATISALSAKVADSNLIVVKDMKLAEAKTKYIANMLKSFNVDSTVLVVVADNDEAVLRASANIHNVTVITAELVNVYDVAANVKLIATVDAIKKLEEVYV